VVFRPGPVVAKFHTHPRVNTEATLAVVGYILVSSSASVVQMYLHRSHTTHHLLKKQPAKLAAEPRGTTFLKIKQSLKWCVKTLRSAGQLMQRAYQVLQKHFRPTKWSNSSTFSGRPVWAEKTMLHYTEVSELRLHQKAGTFQRQWSLSPQRKRSICHSRNVQMSIVPCQTRWTNVTRRILHSSYNIN